MALSPGGFWNASGRAPGLRRGAPVAKRRPSTIIMGLSERRHGEQGHGTIRLAPFPSPRSEGELSIRSCTDDSLGPGDACTARPVPPSTRGASGDVLSQSVRPGGLDMECRPDAGRCLPESSEYVARG